MESAITLCNIAGRNLNKPRPWSGVVPKLAIRKLVKNRLIISFAVLCLLTWAQNTFAQENAQRHVLRKEAPAAALTRPVGKTAATESLRVAISLPVRNRDALDGLLKRLYDPASPDYRQYLTPDQFTANFGPTDEDYQKVINFAQSFRALD